MTITASDRQLFARIKKLAKTTQHVCRLRNAELGDLIAWGCEAVLATNPPQDQIETVAKKAMLARYKQEYITRVREVSFDAKTDYTQSYADTIASKPPEKEDERLKDDSRLGKEWNDIGLTDAAQSPQVQDLSVYKDSGIIAYSRATAERYRQRQTLEVRDLVNGTADSLQTELEAIRRLNPLQRKTYTPFICHLALKLGLYVPTNEQQDWLKYSLHCPLIRACLVRISPLAKTYLPEAVGEVSYWSFIRPLAEQYPSLSFTELKLAATDMAILERKRRCDKKARARRKELRFKLNTLIQ